MAPTNPPDAASPPSAGQPAGVDLSHCPSTHSLANRFVRVLWGVVWVLLFRPSPRVCHGWRRMLLRCFGAKIGRGAHIYPSARCLFPWKLIMGENSCLAQFVDCYNVDYVTIGSNTVISQYSHLCAAGHDYEDVKFPVVAAPIVIGDSAWLCVDVYVAPGVKIGDGAVVGARSSVYKDVEPWTVVGGNPARFLKPRQLRNTTP